MLANKKPNNNKTNRIKITITTTKCSEQNSCCSSLNTTTMAQNESHKRIFHVYKYSASMSALFECNFSTPPILVQLEFHNGSAFNEWLHNRRPQQRIQQYDTKDGFDFEFGLLYRDACTPKLELESAVQSVRRSPGDVITVEIKPKQGWNICSLSGSMLDLLGIVEPVQMKKCRFCAMQCLKVRSVLSFFPSYFLIIIRTFFFGHVEYPI